MIDIKSVKLSTQRALIGCITENTRAISVGFTEDCIILRVYFFEKPSDIEIELLSMISTEILADFNKINSERIEYFTNKVSHSSKLTCLDFWAFMRFEGFD